MKNCIFIIITFLLSSCSIKDSTKNAYQNSVSDTVTVNNIISDEQTEQIANTLKAFQSVDENKLDAGEEAYLMMLREIDDNISNEELLWYRNNVIHVDSVSRYALSLLDSKQYMELQNLLEREISNFQSHPNADTYLWYDYIEVLLNLYRINNLDLDSIYIRMTVHLELLRLRTEAIQSGWEEPHPLYIPILEDLLYIYNMSGNEAKKKEIESRLCSLP